MLNIMLLVIRQELQQKKHFETDSRQTDRQTDTSTDNKGRLKPSDSVQSRQHSAVTPFDRYLIHKKAQLSQTTVRCLHK